MKKNELKELREKTVDAMKQELSDKQRQVFALRTQGVTQKIENPHQSMSTRHDIARLKTLLREKQLQAKK